MNNFPQSRRDQVEWRDISNAWETPNITRVIRAKEFMLVTYTGRILRSNTIEKKSLNWKKQKKRPLRRPKQQWWLWLSFCILTISKVDDYEEVRWIEMNGKSVWYDNRPNTIWSWKEEVQLYNDRSSINRKV